MMAWHECESDAAFLEGCREFIEAAEGIPEEAEERLMALAQEALTLRKTKEQVET